MKEPFFSGLVVFKEWKVLENCLRVWKRSHSNEETPVGRVLTDKYSVLSHSKDTGAVADALTRPVHTWRQEDTARPQRCWYKGLLAVVASYLLSSSWIHRIWFYCHNWGAEQSAKKWGDEEEWEWRLLTKQWWRQSTYFKGARFHFHHWCVLVCPSSNIFPE